MKTITWLHFSDLHICNPKSGWEADYILGKLRKDIESLRDKNDLRPDLIFFTGDAAYGHIGNDGGKSITAQFENAALLFDEIRSIFDPPVPIENFFIVPGNHEVNISKVNPSLAIGFEQKLKGDYNTVEKALSRLIHEAGIEWEDFIKRLFDYRDFLKSSGYSHLLQDEKRLIYAVEREISGIRIGIAGLNSAWSYDKDRKKSELWLAGHWQIQTLNNALKSSDIKIALIHHPINWFNEAEDPQIQKEMENHFHFLLHGHEHQEWVTEKGNGFTCISSGAGYGDSDSETGYNIVRLNLDERKGQVWLRKYDRDGGGWIPKIIHNRTDNNGVVPISLWAKNLKQPDQKIIQQTEEKDDSLKELNSVGEDIPAPSETAEKQEKIQEDASETRGVFGRGKKIEEIAAALKKTPIAFVYGMPGIGKSTLIEEINKHSLFQHCKYFQYFMDEEIGVAALFRQLAKPLGCKDENPRYDFKMMGKYIFSPLEKFSKDSTPYIIHLERVHSVIDQRGFKNPDIKEFLSAITKYYPNNRIILESRAAAPDKLFSGDVCKIFKIQGIDKEGVARYFRRPFRDFPDKGWKLNENDKNSVFDRLGGKQKGESAHPLTMNFLANVADGMNQMPMAVLERHRDKVLKKLEEGLFQDLYEKVLKATEQHLLRLCALYREGIPDSHVGRLTKAVNDEHAFSVLKNRCLLNPNDAEEWYYLHSIIAELTESRMNKQSDEFLSNHEIIADAWLSGLKLSSHPSLPNIKAANQAFYHLLESQNYRRFNELSENLLNHNIIPNLEQLSRRLSKARKNLEDRTVLELIVRIDPTHSKAHRFLGEVLERLKGKGNDEALRHYEEAHRLNPTFPQYLANLGRCLIARKKPEIYISLVKNLDRNVYEKVMDDPNLSVYATSLEETGHHHEASQLRMEQIQKSSRHPAFYNAEAMYLKQRGKYNEALKIIEKAEQRNCANDYTPAIKASLLEKKGEGDKASQLRMEHIRKGIRNPVFYNDEAKYLSGQGKYEEALKIIEIAEKKNYTDTYTYPIKSNIFMKINKKVQYSPLPEKTIPQESEKPKINNDTGNMDKTKNPGEDTAVKTILILAASPEDKARLRLDKEVREIGSGLERSKKRDEFVIRQQWAVRPADFRRAMLDHKPDIVHFCGHGEGEAGIAFEDETGNAKLVSAEALAGFFSLFADKVRCVVLNACYSEIQAKAISQHIGHVIGMNKKIGDPAAVEFAVAFYDALSAGESIQFAYKLGCSAIQMAGISEHLTPVLISTDK